MSKLAIKGNDSGSATFTIEAPATSTDRTLTLPDEAGTVLTSASSISSSQITGSLGITEADHWRLTTTQAASDAVLTNLEQVDTDSYGTLGSGMSHSSGVFTFPSTGIWLIMSKVLFAVDQDTAVQVNTQVSTDGGSNWADAVVVDGGNANTQATRSSGFGQFILDVTSTTNVKVRFKPASNVNGSILGNTNQTETSFSFIRLGDT